MYKVDYIGIPYIATVNIINSMCIVHIHTFVHSIW